MAEENKKQPQPQEVPLSELLKIRRDKLKELQEAGQDPFQQTKFDWNATAQEIKDNFDAMEGKPVKVAGRLMSKRGMGKVSFCDLQDKSGRIQLYARKDEMDEDAYNRFKKYDIGDIVGVKGEVFRTQRDILCFIDFRSSPQDKGDVQLTRQQHIQHFRHQKLVALDRDTGVFLMERRVDACEHIRAVLEGQPYMVGAGMAVGEVLQLGIGSLPQCEHLLCGIQVDPPGFRRLHMAAATVEERDAQVFFQLEQLLVQRRWGDEQPHRSIAHGSIFFNCNYIFQLL